MRACALSEYPQECPNHYEHQAAANEAAYKIPINPHTFSSSKSSCFKLVCSSIYFRCYFSRYALYSCAIFFALAVVRESKSPVHSSDEL